MTASEFQNLTVTSCILECTMKQPLADGLGICGKELHRQYPLLSKMSEFYVVSNPPVDVYLCLELENDSVAADIHGIEVAGKLC